MSLYDFIAWLLKRNVQFTPTIVGEGIYKMRFDCKHKGMFFSIEEYLYFDQAVNILSEDSAFNKIHVHLTMMMDMYDKSILQYEKRRKCQRLRNRW